MKHSNHKIEIKKGTDVHTLVTRLLKLGVESSLIQKATGNPRQAIAAFKAHNTMGTYRT